MTITVTLHVAVMITQQDSPSPHYSLHSNSSSVTLNIYTATKEVNIAVKTAKVQKLSATAIHNKSDRIVKPP